MTEFQATSAPLKRLFYEVDLAARPQSEAAKKMLELWRERRADRLAPDQSVLATELQAPVANHVFFARPVETSRVFLISASGDRARDLLGSCEGEIRLDAVANRRIAARARRLFQVVLRRSEPVSVRFRLHPPGQPESDVELAAAPIAMSDGTIGLVAAIAHRSPSESWTL